MQDHTYKELSMKIPREVIRDLLPLYIAGEASAETRALVEECLRLDTDLRRLVDLERVEALVAARASATAFSPELELRSLRRTRRLLRWQRWLYSWALTLSIVSLSGVGYLRNGRPSFHFFFHDFPQVFGIFVSLALSCWLTYFVFRWRSRSTKL